MWNSAPRMFSGIDSPWVPRAQVSTSPGGRSGSASQPSTPAVSACAQRSFGMRGSSPGGTPQPSIASVSASCSAEGEAARPRVSIATRPARPAASIAAT